MSTHDDLKEDLDYVVAKTGHVRYRDLCDPSHPAYAESWPGTVRRVAAGLRGGDAGAAPVPRSAKPRGSLADAVKQAKECVPCREARERAGR